MDESTEVAKRFLCDKIKAFAKSHLYSKQSDFQKIDIIDTYEFGKVLVVDNWTMVTEKDVIFEDGIKFIKDKKNLYDLIIIDSTSLLDQVKDYLLWTSTLIALML